jgi:oxidase EvaA
VTPRLDASFRLGLRPGRDWEIDGVCTSWCKGKIEPGNRDVLTVAPIVPSILGANLRRERWTWPPCRSRTRPTFGRGAAFLLQPDEGGRFYHVENEYRTVQVPENEDDALPENYLWVSLRQLTALLHFGVVASRYTAR